MEYPQKSFDHVSGGISLIGNSKGIAYRQKKENIFFFIIYFIFVVVSLPGNHAWDVQIWFDSEWFIFRLVDILFMVAKIPVLLLVVYSLVLPLPSQLATTSLLGTADFKHAWEY